MVCFFHWLLCLLRPGFSPQPSSLYLFYTLPPSHLLSASHLSRSSSDFHTQGTTMVLFLLFLETAPLHLHLPLLEHSQRALQTLGNHTAAPNSDLLHLPFYPPPLCRPFSHRDCCSHLLLRPSLYVSSDNPFSTAPGVLRRPVPQCLALSALPAYPASLT